MRSSRFRISILLFCVASFAWGDAKAQLLPAKEDTIYSNILKQSRTVDVYLPKESEKDSAQRYESLYVLDGDGNTQLINSIVTFMRQAKMIPPLIVVSVPNVIDAHSNSRNLDFTPTVVGDAKNSGGAANFLGFLKTELIPYVDAHYPTDHVRVIHGHSFGALFLMYTLVHEPALFNGYLVLDPSLWWDKHSLDPAINASLANISTKEKAIYIAARSGPAFESMGISAIKPMFEHRAAPGLHWQIVPYTDESHESLKLKGTYDALKYVYRGYIEQPITVFPSSGIVLKGKPVFMGFDGNFELFNLHYSTDGSVPTDVSPRITGPLEVSDPEMTQVRQLSTLGIFDRAVPLGLKSGTALPPNRKAKRTDHWHVSLYPAGDGKDIRHGKAFKTFDSDKSLNFGGAGREAFAGMVERNIEVSVAGYYVFGVRTNGSRARLTVGGRPLIDVESAEHPTMQSSVEPLKSGVYTVRLDFSRASDKDELNMVVYQCKDGEPEWWQNPLFELSSQK